MLAALTTPVRALEAPPVHDPLAPVARLAHTPPTRTAFAEARFSPLLKRPLLLHGQLAWLGGDHLERHVDDPYVETTRIGDDEVTMHRSGHGTRHFSLDRAPPLKALLESLVAVLSGDPARLRSVFNARLEQTHAGAAVWSLDLTPRSARLARSLTRIRLDGDRQTLRCIVIKEASGTTSIDLLGPLAAQMPAQPTRARLNALCRHAR